MRDQFLESSKNEQLNNELNHASCDSKIQPGFIYFYYKTELNNKYLSLVKPAEMKIKNSNHEFLGGKAFYLNFCDRGKTLECLGSSIRKVDENRM